MRLTEEQISGLNVACNEATWVGLQINQEQSWVGVTLAVLSLPVEGPAPEDPRIQLILQPLIRVCASYRNGLWNDEKAELLPITIQQLERKVLEGQGLVLVSCAFSVRIAKRFR